jgi:predicted metal-binding transcription factor (methanogenesis marker protein 9)
MTPVKVAERAMTMGEIKDKAKNLGITPGTMKKTELIRAIQGAEGNQTCYGTTNGTCQWTECCWRTDCLKIRN